MANDDTDDQMLLARILFVLTGIGELTYRFDTEPEKEVARIPDEPATSPAGATVPKSLSSNVQIGKAAIAAKIPACDGVTVVEREDVAAPPDRKVNGLSRHGGKSFQTAVEVGVPLHHRSFGNMHRVDALTRQDAAMIIAHIRKLEHTNGIN